MKKAIKELLPGETFLDSFGLALTVIATQPVPFLGIPRTNQKIRVTFKTEAGNEIYQDLRADRIVEVIYEY